MLYHYAGGMLGYGGPEDCAYSDPGQDQAKLMQTDRDERCNMCLSELLLTPY